MTPGEIRAAIECKQYPGEDIYSVGITLHDGKYIGFAAPADQTEDAVRLVWITALEHELDKAQNEIAHLRAKINIQTPVVTWACKYRNELTYGREDSYLQRFVEEVDIYEDKK